MIETTDQRQFLTFCIGDDEYAIGILRVREIIQYEGVTSVPRTPNWIRGVINLRGKVVPVIDVGVKFGFEQREVSSTTCIVITEIERQGEYIVLGVLADSVSQVIEFTADEIVEAPSFGTSIDLDYLQGMAKTENGFVLILDVDQVLPDVDFSEATFIADEMLSLEDSSE